MSCWKEYYESHLMSGEEVVKLIESGDRVWVGNTCDVPYDELDLLADRYEELENVMFFSNLFARPLKMLTDKKYGKAFHHVSYYPGPVEHAGHALGLVDYASVPYTYFRSSAIGHFGINTVFIQVARPVDGYVNIGSWGAFLAAELLKGDDVTKLIGVVNDSIPVAPPATPGLLDIPVERFTAFCENTQPLLVMTEGDPEPIDKQIAANIMEYVEDGDTVQVGKGGLGNAIGFDLKSKKNISVYSEILSDWTVSLDEVGALEKVIAGGCFGAQSLYDWAEKAENIVFDTVPHALSVEEVAKHNKFVAINACMMADLTGQSCSEGSGAWQYSCVGGQLDFIKGANRVRALGNKGMNFLALRSIRTDKQGKAHSNIVFSFPPASAVTCPRTEAMYYVTEYGVAEVWGKSIPERVEAMIPIAHPDFRDELRRQAVESGLLPA